MRRNPVESEDRPLSESRSTKTQGIIVRQDPVARTASSLARGINHDISDVEREKILVDHA